MAHDAPTPSALSSEEEAVLSAVRDDLPRSFAQLGQLVRIPSVSWDGFDASRVAASAEAIAELARESGAFDDVAIHSATIGDSGVLGQPAVLATRSARNGAPTILLYAHHDVQPQGAEAAWETPPFEPTVRGDRLYGRGAADDKAGVVSHLAAVRALREVAGDEHDLGLVLFIEGEEEFGSRSFPTFLRDHHEALRADAIIVADSDNWDVDTPSLTVGLRGNVTFTLTVSTLAHASHSGMLGGAVPDAMLAAVRLLSTLWREDGSVAVEGLIEHTGAVPETTEADLRRDSGLLDGVSPIGTGPILSRTWSKPAVTVTGIDAPSVVDASNTLLPSVRVKISARIAPGQDASEAFTALERHLRAHAPFGAHLAIDDVNTGEPFLVDASGWAVDLVKGAMADAWGREPLETGIGGSIPFIADLVREFPAAQILVTGVEDPDSRAHSPNESLHLGVFKRAAQAEALFLLRAAARRG
ncbi:dipeptidase [Rathayibacter tanaceti]|uniref:M20/M25/M40 family metallo-hydrolase n=2 Tax=Rathayibacter tanaceti TaxID=1671680 RepID=A0A166HHM3_9MICO|nr:dipeptidase [Rathayibacter tanaceti]KZX20611.1 Succinyl-diaminopimelate desuccinylase [Rathayibacter tanaceti]QHC55311.1 M20/M25/M40 family metallo-hydrolase [Rathayibacter tanaceti]TCO36389.1 acetylornithine deacetylase/succinyl-diaminopimelate desuccinylase-like protein [Rathayibacter tanaceti]